MVMRFTCMVLIRMCVYMYIRSLEGCTIYHPIVLNYNDSPMCILMQWIHYQGGLLVPVQTYTMASCG